MEDFTRIAVLPECIYLFNCNEELTSNTLDLLKKEEFTDTSLVNYKTVNVNLNKDLKYEKLYKWFDECILKVHNSYSFDCEKVSITQSWGCKYIYGGHQHFHNHPNSLMSGVFFLTDSDTPTILQKILCGRMKDVFAYLQEKQILNTEYIMYILLNQVN